MHLSAFTLIAIFCFAVWWYKPLRVFLIQRTNRTVKVLLVVFPALFLSRLGYRFYNGTQDQSDVVLLTVGALLLLYLSLVVLSNWLERRRPSSTQGPDWSTLSRLPGIPRIPGMGNLANVAAAAATAASTRKATPAATTDRPAQPGSPTREQAAALPGFPAIPRAAQLATAGIPGVTRRVNAADVQTAAQIAQVAAPHVQRAAQAAAPHVQRAARATVQAAAQATADFDTKDVAGSIGRSSGRLYAKLRKGFKEGATEK